MVLRILVVAVIICFSGSPAIAAKDPVKLPAPEASDGRGAGGSENQAGDDLPLNVVMIVSDDQAWTDYGFMKHHAIQTLNLDRLAAGSALFRRGYTPTPLCRPSLMSMITGHYAHRHGVTGNDPRQDKSLKPEEFGALREHLISKIDSIPTIPKRLADSGYVSLQTGKWWEGNFVRGGFTHGMTRGFPQPGGRHGDDGLDIGRKGIGQIREFIDNAVAGQKPFFVWYAPILPHTPHTPPQRLLEKYLSPERPIELARYFAMCEWFDETCGELLSHLDERKLTSRTLVIYVTDNGWIQATPDMKLSKEWNHGFAPRSKQTSYEGGIRTPIMFSWPGTIPPADVDTPVSTLDVFPTVLAATGLIAPDDLPGRNLLPLMIEQQPLNHRFLCGESYSHDIADLDQPQASLITRWCIEGRWKLILTYDAPEDRYSFVHAVNEKRPQLFDLEADPAEKQNLAEGHPDVVKQMSQNLLSVWNPNQSPIVQ